MDTLLHEEIEIEEGVGIGAESAGPNPTKEGLAAAKRRVKEYYEDKYLDDTVVCRQRTDLDRLARMHKTRQRVGAIVTAYEDYADAIEMAHQELSVFARDNDLLVDGVPEWWQKEITTQRTLREALVLSVRVTANLVAEEYGA